MKAFHDSAYGYDSVVNLMNEVAHKEVAVRMAKEADDKEHSGARGCASVKADALPVQTRALITFSSSRPLTFSPHFR